VPLENPAPSFVDRVRASWPWKVFVVATVPLFDFAWQYVINFKYKLLYLAAGAGRWEKSSELKANAAELYNNDQDFIAFSKWLRSRIPDQLLREKKSAMLNNGKEDSFSTNLEPDLDEETRFKLLEFALSDKVLRKVLPYFKVVPRLDTIFMMYNIPKPALGGPEGSQRWHRDGDIYKMLSLYICLTDLDENSGMYSAVGERNLTYHQAIPIQNFDPTQSIWKNGRHNDTYFSKYISDSQIFRLKGPQGTAALVDGASCYHKGGYCKERERLLFQINFIADQTHERKSILDVLKLKNHSGIANVVNTPLKKALLRENSVKKGKLVFGLARRLLTYTVKASR
jgi:hypothetical protein